MNQRAPRKVVVQLYSRPGCHLCEQAQADLVRLARRYPHSLEVLDITASDDLLERYGQRIPVVRIGQQEYAAPLEASQLERGLQAATTISLASETPDGGVRAG
jgi:hypothetical protein